MIDPFVTAAAVLSRAAGSVPAIYRPVVGNEVACRIVRGRPDEVAPYGGGGIVQATNLFQLLRADVAAPKAGDHIVIQNVIYVLTGVPMLDPERVTWNCMADEA